MIRPIAAVMLAALSAVAAAQAPANPPVRIRGTVGPRLSASVVVWVPGISAMVRFSHPLRVDFTPGVPLSMKSCASKCERESSSDPAACTIARCPSS